MTPLKVLLIEDNESHAALVRRQVQAIKDRRIDLECAHTLTEGIERANAAPFDAALLDLNLPDSAAGKTLESFIAAQPDLPVVVLTTLDDMDAALDAVKQGAQDYLVKSRMSPDLLTRALPYAVERKRSRRQLERYAQELERSNRDFQHFAHFAAHEIKSPLWSVSLACDVLSEKHREQMDEESRELLGGMSSAVRQMARMINDLLEFAKVGGGTRVPQPVECQAVLEQVLAALGPEIERNAGSVTHDPLPPVWADPIQLKQLLQNLIANALKYRREDQAPRVHIAAERRAGEWTISVRDNGLGVPPEHWERIFGLFERVHDRGKYPGTGLGLAICKRIVEAHGGRIWVDSQVGAGSTFYFTLPDQTPGHG